MLSHPWWAIFVQRATTIRCWWMSSTRTVLWYIFAPPPLLVNCCCAIWLKRQKYGLGRSIQLLRSSMSAFLLAYNAKVASEKSKSVSQDDTTELLILTPHYEAWNPTLLCFHIGGFWLTTHVKVKVALTSRVSRTPVLDFINLVFHPLNKDHEWQNE